MVLVVGLALLGYRKVTGSAGKKGQNDDSRALATCLRTNIESYRPPMLLITRVTGYVTGQAFALWSCIRTCRGLVFGLAELLCPFLGLVVGLAELLACSRFGGSK